MWFNGGTLLFTTGFISTEMKDVKLFGCPVCIYTSLHLQSPGRCSAVILFALNYSLDAEAPMILILKLPEAAAALLWTPSWSLLGGEPSMCPQQQQQQQRCCQLCDASDATLVSICWQRRTLPWRFWIKATIIRTPVYSQVFADRLI